MKKFSKKLILVNVSRSFIFSSIFSLYSFISLFMEDSEELSKNDIPTILIGYILGISIITLFSFIYSKLFQASSAYELGDTYVYCKRGVLFKKESTLEYSKINSINKRQTLIQKIFNVATLYLDSGSSNTATNGEIMIIDNSKEIKKIAYELENKNSLEKEVYQEETLKESIYDLKIKDVLISSLDFIPYLISIGLIVALIALIISRDFIIFLMIMSLFIFISLVVFVTLFVTYLIHYYNYKIVINKDKVEVEYGAFTRNTNTFEISKIKAIKIKQGPIQRLFKRASILVSVIGYLNDGNGNNNGDGYLAFSIRLDEVNKLMEMIDAKYVIPASLKYKAPKLLPFIAYPLFFINLILIPLILIITSEVKYPLVFLTSLGILLVINLTVVLISLISKANQGLDLNYDRIIVSNGIMSKTMMICLNLNVTTIETFTTKRRIKQNIKTYNIHIYGNMLTNTLVASHIYVLEDLTKYLKY